MSNSREWSDLVSGDRTRMIAGANSLLPAWVSRLKSSAAREFVRRTLRAETPAAFELVDSLEQLVAMLLRRHHAERFQ